ncbi:hypothetical protein J6590_083291 [Homalodisca vitripennis]|nr:hypothetical protein J6590_083291 [Homalodisca vitripennis]
MSRRAPRQSVGRISCVKTLLQLGLGIAVDKDEFLFQVHYVIPLSYRDERTRVVADRSGID